MQGKPINISRLEILSNSQSSLGAGQPVATLVGGPSCVSLSLMCYRLGFDLPEFVPLAVAPALDPLRAVGSWDAGSKRSRLALVHGGPAHQVGSNKLMVSSEIEMWSLLVAQCNTEYLAHSFSRTHPHPQLEPTPLSFFHHLIHLIQQLSVRLESITANSTSNTHPPPRRLAIPTEVCETLRSAVGCQTPAPSSSLPRHALPRPGESNQAQGSPDTRLLSGTERAEPLQLAVEVGTLHALGL